MKASAWRSTSCLDCTTWEKQLNDPVRNTHHSSSWFAAMLQLTRMNPEANQFRIVRRTYSQSTAGHTTSASPMLRQMACWHHARPKLLQWDRTCRPKSSHGRVQREAGKAMAKVNNSRINTLIETNSPLLAICTVARNCTQSDVLGSVSLGPLELTKT